MSSKAVIDRAAELLLARMPKEKVLFTLYVERYPLSEITAALKLTSKELVEFAEGLSLAFTRCPQGHKLTDEPGLHVSNAHYCAKCGRWFTDGMLRDEINLEVARLREQEKSSTFS